MPDVECALAAAEGTEDSDDRPACLSGAGLVLAAIDDGIEERDEVPGEERLGLPGTAEMGLFFQNELVDDAFSYFLDCIPGRGTEHGDATDQDHPLTHSTTEINRQRKQYY